MFGPLCHFTVATSYGVSQNFFCGLCPRIKPRMDKLLQLKRHACCCSCWRALPCTGVLQLEDWLLPLQLPSVAARLSLPKSRRAATSRT